MTTPHENTKEWDENTQVQLSSIRFNKNMFPNMLGLDRYASPPSFFVFLFSVSLPSPSPSPLLILFAPVHRPPQLHADLTPTWHHRLLPTTTVSVRLSNPILKRTYLLFFCFFFFFSFLFFSFLFFSFVLFCFILFLFCFYLVFI